MYNKESGEKFFLKVLRVLKVWRPLRSPRFVVDVCDVNDKSDTKMPTQWWSYDLRLCNLNFEGKGQYPPVEGFGHWLLEPFCCYVTTQYFNISFSCGGIKHPIHVFTPGISIWLHLYSFYLCPHKQKRATLTAFHSQMGCRERYFKKHWTIWSARRWV